MRTIVAALLLVGCGAAAPPPGSPPTSSARALATALADDDPQAAYALLSADVQKHVSLSTFRDEWQKAAAERARQAAAIRAALDEPGQTGERGRLIFDEGKSTPLRREPAGWRLETPLLAAARASSPQEALRIFAAAVDSRNVDAALRLLTAARREDVRKALESFSQGIRAHLADAIDITGDRATLIWNDSKRGWKVTLKREDGEWRIDDFVEQ